MKTVSNTTQAQLQRCGNNELHGYKHIKKKQDGG